MATKAIAGWHDPIDDNAVVTVANDAIAVRFFPPSSDLRPFVLDIALYETRHVDVGTRITEFLPGAATICIAATPAPLTVRIRNRSHRCHNDAILIGPTSQLIRAEGAGGRIVAITIAPTGWGRFFAAPAHRLANRIAPLAELWDEGTVTALREAVATIRDHAHLIAVVEQTLRARRGTKTRDEDMVGAIAAAIADPASEDCLSIAGSIGIPTPQLRRLTQRHFGFGPKLLLRRTRFVSTTLAILGEQEGHEGKVLERSRYYDQSHFIRDARQFLGKTARQFATTITPLMRAVLERRRQLSVTSARPFGNEHHPDQTVIPLATTPRTPS